ncbi:MAG: hypothetical protein JJT85_00420 [Chromatiales bacterium]|nr:hypothetical protein [Chromatiales bacterium]
MSNAPAFNSRHFTCPHCQQLADQAWLSCYGQPVTNPEGLPLRIAGEGLKQLASNPAMPPEVREQKVAYWNRVNAGEVFLERWAPVQTSLFIAGMEASVCLACHGVAVWLGGECIYPRSG